MSTKFHLFLIFLLVQVFYAFPQQPHIPTDEEYGRYLGGNTMKPALIGALPQDSIISIEKNYENLTESFKMDIYLPSSNKHKIRFLEKGVNAAFLIGADPVDSTIYVREWDDNFNLPFLSMYDHGVYKRLQKNPVVAFNYVNNGIWATYDKKLVRFRKDEIIEEYPVTVRGISPCSSGGCIALTGNRFVYLHQSKMQEIDKHFQLDTSCQANYIFPGTEDYFYIVTKDSAIFLCDPLHRRKPVMIRNLPKGNYTYLNHSKSIVCFIKGGQAGWIDHDRVILIDTKLYPSFKKVESIFMDGSKRIFISNSYEMLIYKNGNFTKYPLYWPGVGVFTAIDCMDNSNEIIYINDDMICRYSNSLKQFYVIGRMDHEPLYLSSGLIRGDSLFVFSRSDKFFVMDLRNYPPLIPQLQFISITYDGKTIAPNVHSDFSYEKPFSIRYKAIEQFGQRAFSYQTRLLGGKDTAWSVINNMEVKEFTSLLPGTYHFEVTTIGESGIWAIPIRFDFTVLPPWYQSGWAYGGYSLAAIALLFGLLQWRTFSLRKDKEKLEKIVQQRTFEVLQQKEEAEKQRQIAEKSAQIKQDFLSNMSHEIRTPLNAISGYTELSLQEALPDKVKKNLQAVKLSSTHLRKLVDDILDISKLESGTMSFHAVHFELTQLIEEIKTLIHFRIKENRNTITSAINPSTAIFLNGDKYKLMQVLINLLDNAAKFTSDGKITIHVEVKDTSAHEVMLLFRISDTGIGIPPEKIVSIFESFAQADNSISRKYGGAGLGLSISKKIIELQGGQISVSSEAQQGSVFSFQIPFLKGKKILPEKDPPIVYQNRLAGLRILVAEDDPVNQDLLLQLLQQWKIKVDFAATGTEALELLKTIPYQLLLLDIHMPVLNGFEVAKYIRTTFPLSIRDIPIIALTADVLPATREAMNTAGIYAHVYKPIDAAILYAEIHQILRLSPPLLQTGNTPDLEIPTRYINLDYLTKNFGSNINYMLSSLTKSSYKLIEYTNAIRTACRENNSSELLFYTHRLKGIAAVLGMDSVIKTITRIDQLVKTGQSHMVISEEIKLIHQTVQMAFKEITEVIKHLSKNSIV